MAEYPTSTNQPYPLCGHPLSHDYKGGRKDFVTDLPGSEKEDTCWYMNCACKGPEKPKAVESSAILGERREESFEESEEAHRERSV